MALDVIVLNGGSSSGKSSLARSLQVVLRQPWLSFGVDNLIEALPPQATDDRSGVVLGGDGVVTVGPRFRPLEAAWYAGLAAMARAGGRTIVDEVFLDGGDSQARLAAALDGIEVLWVGVRCDVAVAIAREAARSDRIPGMAASQAESVHQGVQYDVQVDTSRTPSVDCAREVAVFAGL